MGEPRMDHIMQVGLGFWASKTLLSARDGVVHGARKTSGRPADFGRKAGAASASARDFLDALVALGFLERTDGTYSNTPSTDFFLDKRKPSYIGGMLEMANLRLYSFWNNLTTALRTGELQNEAKGGGTSFFAALYADPERLKGFLKAMTGLSNGANQVIASKFPWKDYRTAADIGTAQGDLIVQVALANPHISWHRFRS